MCRRLFARRFQINAYVRRNRGVFMQILTLTSFRPTFKTLHSQRCVTFSFSATTPRTSTMMLIAIKTFRFTSIVAQCLSLNRKIHFPQNHGLLNHCYKFTVKKQNKDDSQPCQMKVNMAFKTDKFVLTKNLGNIKIQMRLLSRVSKVQKVQA